MKLSVPLYQLKRNARLLSREVKIPFHAALDKIAVSEGFRSWSLLMARTSAGNSPLPILSSFKPGELLLVGSRPGHGKTAACLKLAAEAARSGKQAAFFTLEHTRKDVSDRLQELGVDESDLGGRLLVDCSDAISAGYICRKLASVAPGSLVVVDYLQLLDQKRENPELSVQIRNLKAFAKTRELAIVMISQIDRSYEESGRAISDAADVRLPNPLDLKLFDRMVFLQSGQTQHSSPG